MRKRNSDPHATPRGGILGAPLKETRAHVSTASSVLADRWKQKGLRTNVSV
jgi:hypothetical protein